MLLWPLPDLTTPDVVACLWKTGDIDIPEVVLVSAYSDITLPFPLALERVAEYCRSRNVPCILGADTNGHSVLWGSPNNNDRGDDFELFAACYDLAIVNVGNTATYSCATGSSIIDVTFAHYTLYDKISNWRVSLEDYS